MTFSVQLNKFGPLWVLGNIVVPTPGTTVGIMSLVDPNGYNNPNKVQSNQFGSPAAPTGDEYTRKTNQVVFQAVKSGGGGLVPNAGNIYVCLAPQGAGVGGRADLGCIVALVAPGQFFTLVPPATMTNIINPYQVFLDADNANDAAQVTLVIG